MVATAWRVSWSARRPPERLELGRLPISLLVSLTTLLGKKHWSLMSLMYWVVRLLGSPQTGNSYAIGQRTNSKQG